MPGLTQDDNPALVRLARIGHEMDLCVREGFTGSYTVDFRDGMPIQRTRVERLPLNRKGKDIDKGLTRRR